ncbi:putative RNA polymerase-associated protein Rtf1 [Helianthus annuus]|nr:putative Plus-3 domain, Plus3-like superfamily protein [Helianthus annuus]KAJ0665654.1 putative Plus-3 domain, Plus3-like superfamily protein [Helianthus annuus]KAJ0851411.1 putative RNA polymerase-associated protein Rtf1 [Helianthus annuus]
MNDTELEFAVSIANQLMKNTNTGVGANASSKADMMQFVGSDTLAELVWSPRTGLNIKFAEEKPCFMWEVGPTDMSSENTQNEQHIASLATCHVSCTGSQNQGAVDKLYEHLFEDGMMGGCDGSGSETRPPLKIEPMMQYRPEKHAERADADTHNVKMEKDGYLSDPFLENAQVAIFNNKTAERHQLESSHGSMESCRSANFLTERKRKCGFEQQLILGSKRIKKRIDGGSFMNWISNTLKGLKNNHNVYDPRVGVCDETSGFRNVFQSLFSTETIKQFENKSKCSCISKETVLAERCSHGSLGYVKIKDKENVKHVSFYERVTIEAPKNMFDTIRKLRLSRTDIIKWMNSRSSVSCNLDGFFLRLRVAKWEEGAGGSKYYVACITGSQGETPCKDFKQSIRVKVGDVECLVQSQHVSNNDFLEDELIAWWEKTLQNGGIPVVKDLKSKLAERKTLGV